MENELTNQTEQIPQQNIPIQKEKINNIDNIENVQLPNKTSNKLLYVLLIIIFLFLVLSVSGYYFYTLLYHPKGNNNFLINSESTSENQPEVTSNAVKIEEKENLTKDGVEQSYPVIYKNTIAWFDLSENTIPECKEGNIAHQSCVSQIFIYNIDTKTKKKITSNQTWKSSIKLTDNYILWGEQKTQMDFEEEKTYLMNLSTGKKVEYPSIDLVEGNKAISYESNKKAYLLNLDTQEKTLLMEKTGNGAYDSISNVIISGNYIIWQEGFWKQGGENGVVVYGSKVSELQNKKEITRFQSSYGAEHSIPDISNNFVVWEAYEKENPETKNLGAQYYAIYLFDINTGNKRVLVSKKGTNSSPKIWGNYVIYQDIIEMRNKIINIRNNNIEELSTEEDVLTNLRWIDIENNYIAGTGNPSLYAPAQDIYLLKLSNE